MKIKLNSFKTYEDKGLAFIYGCMVSLIIMLCIGLRGTNAEAQTDESDEKKFVACYGCTAYDSGSNSCVYNERSKRCEAGFPESETETAGTAELREPGMLTEDGSHQLMPEINKDTPHERFKELASAYGLDASKIRAVENHYGITEGVVLCITVAETSGGNRGYGSKNIGSVGSNDRGDRPTYALEDSGLEAIGKTLTNKYLGGVKTLGCLSNAGSCQARDDHGYRYATSTGPRERNMVACLSTIYGNINASEFLIHNR